MTNFLFTYIFGFRTCTLGPNTISLKYEIRILFLKYVYKFSGYQAIFCSKTNEMPQFFKLILFCSSNLHVSNDLSVHLQESKTVRAASGVCQAASK